MCLDILLGGASEIPFSYHGRGKKLYYSEMIDKKVVGNTSNEMINVLVLVLEKYND